MDVWILYDTLELPTRNAMGVFSDAHAGLAWLIHQTRDHPGGTVGWHYESGDGLVKIIGSFPPPPDQPAGWSQTYELERTPVLDGP